MSSDRIGRRVLLRAGIILAGAGSLGGCFSPLYGDRGVAGSSGNTRAALSGIDVAPIGSRVGIILRNELIYLTGGGSGRPAAPTHLLAIQLGVDSVPLLLDTGGGRPTVQTTTLIGNYTLTEVSSGTIVRRGSAMGSASIDRGAQRLAAEQALRNAQERAAKSLAEQIVTEIAAWFATRG